MTLINFPAPSSLMLLPLAAILLFLRTGTEELFFHGNILQQLAARFQNPLIWFALPPIAFGLLHYELTVYGGIPLGGGRSGSASQGSLRETSHGSQEISGRHGAGTL